jgi:hypothetical protein
MRFERRRLSRDDEATHGIQLDGRGCYRRKDGLDGLNISLGCVVACRVPLAQPNAAPRNLCHGQAFGGSDCVTQ